MFFIDYIIIIIIAAIIFQNILRFDNETYHTRYASDW